MNPGYGAMDKIVGMRVFSFFLFQFKEQRSVLHLGNLVKREGFNLGEKSSQEEEVFLCLPAFLCRVDHFCFCGGGKAKLGGSQPPDLF